VLVSSCFGNSFSRYCFKVLVSLEPEQAHAGAYRDDMSLVPHRIPIVDQHTDREKQI
jgi:hypothetical protein